MNIKQAHAGNKTYDENFYRAQKIASFISAEATLPHVVEFIRPRSVVDVGCGVGAWLAAWQKVLRGRVEVFGIDGDFVDRSQLLIAEKNFSRRQSRRPSDFESPVRFGNVA